jgi:hypothetical protein
MRNPISATDAITFVKENPTAMVLAPIKVKPRGTVGYVRLAKGEGGVLIRTVQAAGGRIRIEQGDGYPSLYLDW